MNFTRDIDMAIPSVGLSVRHSAGLEYSHEGDFRLNRGLALNVVIIAVLNAAFNEHGIRSTKPLTSQAQYVRREEEGLRTGRRVLHYTGSSPTKLWRSLIPLLQSDKRSADVITPTSKNADSFVRFLDEKVKAVRASTEGQQPPAYTSSTADESMSEPVICYLRL